MRSFMVASSLGPSRYAVAPFLGLAIAERVSRDNSTLTRHGDRKSRPAYARGEARSCPAREGLLKGRHTATEQLLDSIHHRFGRGHSELYRQGDDGFGAIW